MNIGDSMKLKDILPSEELFHPQTFYEGEWLLGGPNSLDGEKDILILNAKKINGKNMYEEFLEKYFYTPISDIIGSVSMSRVFFPRILLTEKNEKRQVLFSLPIFLCQQLAGLLNASKATEEFLELGSQESSEKDWVTFIKGELKKERKFYYDVFKNGNKSSNYAQVYQLYLDYIRYSETEIPFDIFLDGKISACTKLLVASRYYPDFFSKEIPLEPFLQAFDYDTLCLVAAKSSIDNCKATEKRVNLVDNSIGFVRSYLDSVDELREENPDYNCAIVVIDEETGYRKTIKIEDIERDYKAILARHPEFSFIVTNKQEIETLLKREGMDTDQFDPSLRRDLKTLESLLLKIRSSRELAAEWEFIPKGTGEISTASRGISNIPNQTLSEDEKIRRMLIGRDFLENSDYAYKIYGIHKFEGYVGYIYPNETVIFEKYYENVKTAKIAVSSATYVMDLYNFMELSKLSKTEIINIIHTDSSANVRRVFHRENMDRWKSEVAQVISGSDYTNEVLSYVDDLISHNSLKKNEVVK